VRIRLDIAYDGTDFHGWAEQPELRTVQGVLEEWLLRMLRQEVQLTVAGRTDAGVHARGQVAHFDVDAESLDSKLLHRLNSVLPEDVVITGLSEVTPDFDARFSALWRRYVYRLCDGVPDPLQNKFVVRSRYALDVAAMNQAGQSLLGLHDFAAFAKYREGATAIRTLQAVRVERMEGLIELTFVADAFAHSMVRSLTGALLDVGSGRRDAVWLAGLLDRHERCGEITVMPAKGLTLEEVGYPPPEMLAARAAEARARRG
jgi:tRNA pseudouridine38-40 synthase